MMAIPACIKHFAVLAIILAISHCFMAGSTSPWWPDFRETLLEILNSILLGFNYLQEFKRHIRKDHNMWAYVYYSIYLDQIDVTNHNAIEKYVYEKVLHTNFIVIAFAIMHSARQLKEI